MVVAVLLNAGAHVPVIPLVDDNGNIGAVVPLHIAGIAAKVGMMFGLTVTLNVAVVAH